MSGTGRELEASVGATASSVDGRRFKFQCSLHELELQSGGYVSSATDASAKSMQWTRPGSKGPSSPRR